VCTLLRVGKAGACACTGLGVGTPGAGQDVQRGPCLHWAACGYS
jgi:hypothetical protein